MDSEIRTGSETNVGVRMGHRVTIRKLEKKLPDGTKAHTHPRYLWRATFVKNGKRCQKYFKTKADAELWAIQQEIESRAHGTDIGLTAMERAAVIDNRPDLEKLGLSLREAICFAVDHHRRARQSCTVTELVETSIFSRKRAGLSERHTNDLKCKLGRFAMAFGQRSVATITKSEIENWLYGLGLSPASFNSYRRILVVAFNDAKRDGQINHNPAEQVRPAKVVESEVGILSPSEAAAILAGGDVEILPVFALGLFAGLRMAELERLDWSEVHVEMATIRVKASKSKSAKNRIVPMAENLKLWLQPHVRSSGSVWPDSHQRGRRQIEAAHRLAGFGTAKEARDAVRKGLNLRKWPDNALRHSFATYHLALHENAASLALHLGHTNTNIIFAHYRLPVSKEDALLYWSISPETAKEISQKE